MNKNEVLILMNKTIYIVDIDGTICDSIPRGLEINRELGVIGDNIDISWDDDTMKLFMKDDFGVVEGAHKLKDIIFNGLLIFLTGRNRKYHNITKKWIIEKFGVNNPILFTRPDEDRKMPVADGKEKLFLESVFSINSLANYIFFEDNDEVIKRWRKYGMALKAPECWSIL